MVTLEALILIVNSCVLVLAIMDNQDNQKESVREALGSVILYSSMVFSTSSLLFLGLKAMVGVRKLRAEYKLMRAEGKTLRDGWF